MKAKAKCWFCSRTDDLELVVLGWCTFKILMCKKHRNEIGRE
jgi:hypothetical protein